MRRFKFCILLLGVLACGCLLCGCSLKKTDGKKLKDLEFTVVEDADVPEQLMQKINEKKKEPFKLSYTDPENLYIVVGYGEQKTGGYSISVDELYLASDGVYIKTNLIGPSKEEYVTNTVTYPYVVVKTEFTDQKVFYK